MVQSRLKLLDRWPISRRITTAKLSPKKQGTCAPHWVPQPDSAHGQDEPPESLAWKASGVGVWGSLRAIQKKDFSFKGCIQNSCMLWGPVQRQKFEKRPGTDPLADLGEPPGKVKDNWYSQVHRQWWQSIWGPFITTRTLVLASTILEPSL